MESPAEPLEAVDIVASTGWMFGAAVAVAATVFSLTAAFEWFVYDVRVFGPSWSMAGLLAVSAGWITMMVIGAQRLRIDEHGIALRRLGRDRNIGWESVQLVGVRAPVVPMVDGVLTVVADYRCVATPWALNAHDAYDELAARVEPLAEPHQVNVDLGVPNS